MSQDGKENRKNFPWQWIAGILFVVCSSLIAKEWGRATAATIDPVEIDDLKSKVTILEEQNRTTTASLSRIEANVTRVDTKVDRLLERQPR